MKNAKRSKCEERASKRQRVSVVEKENNDAADISVLGIALDNAFPLAICSVLMDFLSLGDLYALQHAFPSRASEVAARIKRFALDDPLHINRLRCLHVCNGSFQPWILNCDVCPSPKTLKTREATTQYPVRQSWLKRIPRIVLWIGTGFFQGHRELRKPVPHFLERDVAALARSKEAVNRATVMEAKRDKRLATGQRLLVKEGIDPEQDGACQVLSEFAGSAHFSQKQLVTEARAAVTKATRRAELVAALKTKGLLLRGDSRLCAAYIDGSEDHTLNELVEEMALMRWLHEYTDYASNAREMAREEMSATYGWLPKEEVHGIYEGARQAVKAELAARRPAVWPWLEKHTQTNKHVKKNQ